MKLRRDCDLYQEKKSIFPETIIKSDLYHLFTFMNRGSSPDIQANENNNKTADSHDFRPHPRRKTLPYSSEIVDHGRYSVNIAD